MIREKRVRELRNGEGVDLLLHLDLPQSLREYVWEEGDHLALDRRASLAVARLLDRLPRGAAHVIAGGRRLDEASRAVALLLACGTQRQAFLASVLEAAVYTMPDGLDEQDPLDAMSQDQGRAWFENRWQQEMTRIGCQLRPARGDCGMSEADAIAEVERLFEKGA